jgi:ELWxxDGT repeat protein
VNSNGRLYFAAAAPGTGIEPWTSDGTPEGTVLLVDAWPGSQSGSPYDFTRVGDSTYFTAIRPNVGGCELWRTDGTASGTQIVSTTARDPRQLTDANGRLFFVGTDPVLGESLWTIDGVDAGARMVKDVRPDDESYMWALTNVSGTLYFTNLDLWTSEWELWKSDGTEDGTVLVATLTPTPEDGSDEPFWLTNLNGTLFFTQYDPQHGAELWKSDGTPSGTVMVADLFPGSVSSNPWSLANVNGTLYFSARDSQGSQRVWSSDGTAAGTTQVDFAPGDEGTTVGFPSFVQSGGIWYFTATHPVHGTELYRLDGVAPCTPPQISDQPVWTNGCRHGDVSLTLAVDGTQAMGYQWRKDTIVIDRTTNPSAGTAMLHLADLSDVDAGWYDCIVFNGCGSVNSAPAMLSVCISDFNCDGGVDGSDVDAFFTGWEAGEVEADLNGDGGVDSADVDVFFVRWESGC